MTSAIDILNLCEDYFAGRKFGNRHVELFKNPSKSELLEITEKSFKNNSVREIRFAINPENQTIFVCDGYVGLHPDIRSLANYTEDDLFIVYGLAVYDGNKFIVNPNDCYSEVFRLCHFPKYREVINTFLNFKWKWVSRYVIGTEAYINKIRLLREN